ncbi:helix-turn-helix domain-containing protein [Halostagnicola sp. A-GB9-2]|nr:helix-turn-helix domain-containing protein [Halostagnicola sp. A-GB9-2]MDJ1433675.1 helix-turn-helix domain-containing protein [Halostagnicola sp. A-GB9-2]
MIPDVPLSTVGRAFEIIEYIRNQDGATVAEITSALELPKSTVHDYVRYTRSTRVSDQRQRNVRPESPISHSRPVRPERYRVCCRRSAVSRGSRIEDRRNRLVHCRRGWEGGVRSKSDRKRRPPAICLDRDPV